MKYDHIVVGGGTAGCIVAARLSEDPERSVLLLEAGPDFPDFAQLPDMLKLGWGQVNLEARAAGSPYNWSFTGTATPEQAEPMPVPRGKVLGGSSAINGQTFIRGAPEDFDTWASLGNEGWSYIDCLPYFRKLENDADFRDDFHGTDGPVPVRHHHRETWPPLQEAFFQAATGAGYPFHPDVNHPEATGVSLRAENNIDGVRMSMALAYIDSVRHRLNLTIRANVQANRVALAPSTGGELPSTLSPAGGELPSTLSPAGGELPSTLSPAGGELPSTFPPAGGELQGGAFQAIGVEVESGGETFVVEGGDIILCAGAVASPQLLMLSGLGPRDLLERLGIPVAADLPGVGQNMRDHPNVTVRFQVKDNVPEDPIAMRALRLRYTATGSDTPNDMILSPASLNTVVRDSNPAHTVNCGLYLAAGKGELWLTSADPNAAPEMDYHYLEEPWDLERLREAVRLCITLLEGPAYAPYIEGVLSPTPADLDSDEALNGWLKRNVSTSYHISGTCKMGAGNDPMAVVDHRLRVRGVSNLRIADASIMPDVVRANTNVTTMMIAERVADFIKAGS